MVLANDLQEVGRVIDTLDVQSHRVMALDVHHISSWCLPKAAISGASFARSCSFTSSRSRPLWPGQNLNRPCGGNGWCNDAPRSLATLHR